MMISIRIWLGTLGLVAVSTMGVAAADNRGEIEKEVRKQIESEIQAKELKVKALEAELELIKSKLAARKKNMEAIVLEKTNQRLAGSGNVVTKQPSNESAEELAAEGWKLWQEQKYAAAAPKFRRASEIDPKNANTWNGLGWSEIHSGKTTAAIDAFKKALAIEPKHGGAKNGLGQSLIALGKLDEAEKVLLESTKDIIAEYGEKQAVEAGVTVAWMTLVDLKIKRGDMKGAKEWADRYLAHKPDDPYMKPLADKIK